MASDLLRRRVLVLAALVFVAGCPATCQTRREIRKSETSKTSAKTSETQKKDQKSGEKKRRTHLRPDGTPWLIEDDLSWLTDASITWKYGHSTTEIDRKVVDIQTTRPWWHWPVRIAVIAVVLTILAYLLYRRIKR